MNGPVLEACDVSARLPGTRHDVVRHIEIAIEPGEIVVMVGPNGSGKSTTLGLLAGALRPRVGRILLHGQDLRRTARRTIALRLARLPQESTVPEGVTVEQVVRFGRHPHESWLRGEDSDGRRAVDEALERVGVQRLRTRPMETLSGGERKRAWLAMVLAQAADIILLDEPTASLDLRHQLELLDLVRELRTTLGRTVLLVLHDLDHALRVADRVVVLRDGEIFRQGAPADCLDEQALRDVFGVRGRLVEDPQGSRLAVDGVA